MVRASQRILRSFSDWHVLEEMPEKGVYRASGVQRLEDPELIAWLLEASLLSSGQETKYLKGIMGGCHHHDASS